MAKVLDELYYGNIRPWERANIHDEKYKKLAQENIALSDKLKATNIDNDLFDQFLKINDELTEYLRKESFINGLSLGIILMTEVYNFENEFSD